MVTYSLLPARALCVALIVLFASSTTFAFCSHNLSILTSQYRGTQSNDIRVQSHKGDTVENINNDGVVLLDRQKFMKQLLISTSGIAVIGAAKAANAQDEEDSAASVFVRKGKGFSYRFAPPPGFSEGNKPLKTHLDEVNFTKEGVRGYQYGITIDPVRLKSLSEFGTPEQVAAKIVTAEVNRDGIFEVTLYRDPVEDPITGAYEIDYVSDGKRGKKRFMTRTAVQDGMLYVLTAQVKDEEFNDKENEMKSTVKTFVPGQ